MNVRDASPDEFPRHYEVLNQLFDAIRQDYPSVVFIPRLQFYDGSNILSSVGEYDHTENRFLVRPEMLDETKTPIEEFRALIAHEWAHYILSRDDLQSLATLKSHLLDWLGMADSSRKTEECRADYFASRYADPDALRSLLAKLAQPDEEDLLIHPRTQNRLEMIDETEDLRAAGVRMEAITFDEECDIVDAPQLHVPSRSPQR